MSGYQVGMRAMATLWVVCNAIMAEAHATSDRFLWIGRIASVGWCLFVGMLIWTAP